MEHSKITATTQESRDDVNRRPSPETIKARHAEIARRYAWNGKGRGKRKPGHGIANLRLRQLERLFHDRYGDALPDDDAGRDDLLIALHHIAALAQRADEAMTFWAAVWAPWIDEDELKGIIETVLAKPLKWKAATLGSRLRLTGTEHDALGITTFRPHGVSDADQRERRQMDKNKAKTAKRRAAGSVPREEWLAGRLSRSRPWEAEGISESTWRRRKRRAQTSDRSPGAADIDLLVTPHLGHDVPSSVPVSVVATAIAALYHHDHDGFVSAAPKARSRSIRSTPQHSFPRTTEQAA